MPRKEFEAFTRLDASDVNTYLMDQTVMTFADSAARGSAIPTPVDGMITYLIDTQIYEGWNGSAWIDIMDLGAWRSWAPTLSGGFANGNGVWSARYMQLGKTVHFSAEFTSGTTSTYGAGLRVSLPVNAVVRSAANIVAYQERGTSRYQLFPLGVESTYTILTALNASATYLSTTNISATIPLTWATGDVIAVAGTYEAA